MSRRASLIAALATACLAGLSGAAEAQLRTTQSGAGPSGSGGQAGSGVTAERPDLRVQLDFQHYYTLDELDESLAALAAAYPEFLRLESMGRSAGGNELWVLTVTRLSDGDPEQKPGLLLAGGLGEGDLWGSELALFTVLELVQNHRRDPRVSEILARTVLYVVPSVHPDLRRALFGSDGSRSGFEPRASVDGNFEMGWAPGGQGAGPYPLSQPETHGLARFFMEHENIAALQLYGGDDREAAEGRPSFGLTAGDEDLHRLIASRSDAGDGAVLAGLPELAADGGTLLEFAHGHRGAFGFVTRVAGVGGALAPDVSELFGLGRRAFGASLELARALPQVKLGAATSTRLAKDLWQVDISIENEGTLPTLSELGTQRFATGSPRVTLVGAELVAAAVRAEDSEVYEVAPMRSGSFSIDELGGGAARDLRLVLRGTEGTGVTIEARSPRGGLAELDLPLQ